MKGKPDGHALRWEKQIALTGDWTAPVCAASEAEVRELHDEEQRLSHSLAQQYPGPYRGEALPPGYMLPLVLEALEEGDVARVEHEQGLSPLAAKEAKGFWSKLAPL